jgi:hypothetical protein
MRTKKGNVTAEARKKAGNKKGKFPIFDHKSCVSAVKLRGHGDRAAVLARAATWARKNNDKG